MCLRRPGLSIRTAAALVVALVTAAGCAKANAPHPNSAGSETSPRTTAPSSVVAPQQVPLDCRDVHLAYNVKLRDQHIRCVLQVNAGLTLAVSSDPPWSFTLRDAASSIQEFREPVDEISETGVTPLLQDIDNSGTPALLVAFDRGGTGGEPMAVWRLAGQPPRFVRAGEIFGFRRFYQTPEGFFGNYAHSSAASGTVTLYRWVNDKLVAVAVLEMQAAAASLPSRHDWVRNGNVLCALTLDDDPPGSREGRSAALRAAGVDPATAQQKLCAESWVATVYQ